MVITIISLCEYDGSLKRKNEKSVSRFADLHDHYL